MTDKQCEVEGCINDARYKAMCNMHYKRWNRNGSTDAMTPKERGQRISELAQKKSEEYVMPQTKVCTRCKNEKPIEDFYTRPVKYGIRPYPHCKKCHHSLTREINRKAREKEKASRPPRVLVNGGTCKIEWCTRDAKSKGMCKAHYQREREGRDMDAPILELISSKIDIPNHRQCTFCDEVKHDTEFYLNTKGVRRATCGKCTTTLAKIRQAAKNGQMAKAMQLVEECSGRLRDKAEQAIAPYLSDEGRGGTQ